jgi:photosystem II stability/assembly factor-like uncharacterized protein
MAKAGLLFVGTDDGIVLFSNPGAVGRWLRVGHELRGKAVMAAWARPDNPLVVLAACGNDGLWRSADGGQSWQNTVPAPVALLPAGDALVALGGKEPALLLAAQGDLWRSADDGQTWERGLADAPLNGDISVLTPAGYHIDTAFAGTTGGQVYQSTDRGRTWAMLKDGLPAVRAISAARLV